MEGFGNTAQGVSVASLAVPPTAKGRYDVNCTVENRLGSESRTATVVVHKKRIPVNFSVTQTGQDINSTVTLRCEPQSSRVSLSSVNLTFAGGQLVFWKDGRVHSTPHVIRQDFDEDRKSLTVAVRSAPFMRGNVRCQLESTDFSSVGAEERQIKLEWKARPLRLLTRIENTSERDWMKEGDTLNVTCEVELGSSPTKERVRFSGRGVDGRRRVSADLLHDGWTLRNVSTQVRLSWQHDRETVGCSLGGKTVTQLLQVEYAPKNLVIGPSLAVNPGQAVRCTAMGAPTPSVRIRPVNPQPGWREITGNGTGQLLVAENAEERGYALVCEAKNRHGEGKRISAVLVQKNPIKTRNLLPTRPTGGEHVQRQKGSSSPYTTLIKKFIELQSCRER